VSLTPCLDVQHQAYAVPLRWPARPVGVARDCPLRGHFSTPYGTTLELDDHAGTRLRWLPVVDKLRTFTELDPETVQFLSL